MDLVAYFEGRKSESERSLHFVLSTPGFRLLERSAAGPDLKDVTAEHIEHLREEIREFDNMLASLRADSQPSQ